MTFRISNVLVRSLACVALFVSHTAWSQEENASAISDTVVPATVAAPAWVVRLPPTDTIDYRGVLNMDNAGNTPAGGMLYPAPNLVGFLAAVVTHGVLNESSKSIQKSKMQASADRLLLPYRDTLLSFRLSELVQHSLERTSIKGSRLMAFSEKMTNEWVIEAQPIFSVTQDETAIILDNAITMSQVGADPSTAYMTVIRVISAPQDEATLSKFWMAEKGAKMHEESVKLYAQSLDLALNEFEKKGKDDDAPYRTVRYRQGGAEKMERAKVIKTDCNRMLIKTLRGHLMSVPLKTENSNPAEVNKCT
ncbi:hypothetical protein DBR37_15645 [Herminiimonas sp. KBW02]|uniref:hypothetical protein n=1 Tax=Herminiimonas sp. KBW02 TaxID=2153363 RepID=UPI000F5A3795|nr:hypothetical protein [Herminiimonas sp. KBW02]RQO33612.1 hypothetical protein DBR37_15645 [Herminiimonas sp. KBW02]